MGLLQSAGNFYLYYKIAGMYIVSILFFIIGAITIYYTSSKHTVHYDANNRSDATTNKMPTWFGFLFMGIGSLVLMIAIGFTMFAMNTNANTRATAGGFLAGMNAISYATSSSH